MNNNDFSPWQVLKILFSFIQPYKWIACLALFALVITAGLNLSIGYGVKLVIDNGFIAGSTGQLQQAIILMLALVLLISVGSFCRFYLMSWLGERICADIRLAIFNQIIDLHPSYFEDNRQGEIMSRLTTDTTLFQSIVGSSLSLSLRSSLMALGGIAMMLITNLKLTLLVLIAVPLILLPVVFFGKKIRILSKQTQDDIAGISTYAGEVMQNIKTVQSYNRQHSEQQAFQNQVESAFHTARRRIKHNASLFSIVIVLTFSAISLMMWIGGLDVIEGRMSGGELAAFVFYAIMVSTSIATVSEVYGELQRAAGAGKRLVELLQVKSKITNIQQPIRLTTQNQSSIHFNNVSFSYPSRPGEMALNHFNLTIPAGKTMAIVGPSGAGKSTVFELLQRFYDPQQGEITLDGQPINHIELQDLRQQMAIVPQQPKLFSHHVYYNIGYGQQDADPNQITAVAQQAHAAEFIEALPDQYHSFLGEGGVRLSGGQKQRIAIARALLKDPQILLLDEATSALDAQSEYHVQAALNELMKQRTTVIIAHRLATVIHADIIVVMDQGSVVATGDHQSLLASCQLYRGLCELQFEQGKQKANLTSSV